MSDRQSPRSAAVGRILNALFVASFGVVGLGLGVLVIGQASATVATTLGGIALLAAGALAIGYSIYLLITGTARVASGKGPPGRRLSWSPREFVSRGLGAIAAGVVVLVVGIVALDAPDLGVVIMLVGALLVAVGWAKARQRESPPPRFKDRDPD